MEEQGLRAYLPLPDYASRSSAWGKSAFLYHPQTDTYPCPHQATLRYVRANRSAHLVVYQADAAICRDCPLKERYIAHLQG